ncbi:MAG: hypothetical protein WCP10_09245 [Desulfuromonadales bacterium]
MAATCLHVSCLPYHLLIDVCHILEICEIEADDVCRPSRRRTIWRDGSIEVIDLRSVLGSTTPPPPSAALVCCSQDGNNPRMYLCDHVHSVVTLEDHELLPLPHASGRIGEFADAVSPDPVNAALRYRMKGDFFDVLKDVTPSQTRVAAATKVAFKHNQ